MKKIAVPTIIIGILVAVIWVAGSLGRASSSLEKGAVHMKKGVENLKSLNSIQAGENFTKAEEAAKGIEQNLKAAQLFFSGAPSIFKGVFALAGSGIALAGELEYIEVHALEALAAGNIQEILARLRNIQKALGKANEETRAVTSGVQNLGGVFPELITPFAFDIEAAEKFLQDGLAWLDAKKGRRFAILFQNPGEMRPAGGFLGSFAEIYIKDGIVSSTIRDILEADREFERNIVPPRPLQGIMRRWKAADANWFFDFPTSAAHVAEFLEGSRLYKNEVKTFDSIIAISPRPIEDILRYVGPLEIKELGSVRAENFLEVLQKSVQEKQARGEVAPKEGLNFLWKEIFSRLEALEEEDRESVLKLLRSWILDKDIMVYMKDSVLQAGIEQYGIGGEVFELPPDFEGDYLAIVDANVEGGKTDRYVRTKVIWESQIGNDGITRNQLMLVRKHEGDKSTYEWNRLPNTDFLQIITPPQSRLVDFSGGEAITLPSTDRYAKGFARDPLLEDLERSKEKVPGFLNIETHREAGKRTWSTYLKTPLRGEKGISLSYEHQLLATPQAGTKYTFVFEKQAGTEREYEFTIVAPTGLRFKETKLPVWSLATTTLPGRLIVNLSLEPDASFSQP